MIYFIKIYFNISKPETSKTVSVILFSLSVLFAIALPIFFKLKFINKVKNLNSISLNDFYKFEKAIMKIALLTPYFIILSLVLNLKEFYFTGIILMSIYACYYYFPSEKRMKFEKTIFRIKEH